MFGGGPVLLQDLKSCRLKHSQRNLGGVCVTVRSGATPQRMWMHWPSITMLNWDVACMRDVPGNCLKLPAWNAWNDLQLQAARRAHTHTHTLPWYVYIYIYIY